jgi:hypothetical protein
MLLGLRSAKASVKASAGTSRSRCNSAFWPSLDAILERHTQEVVGVGLDKAVHRGRHVIIREGAALVVHHDRRDLREERLEHAADGLVFRLGQAQRALEIAANLLGRVPERGREIDPPA